MRHTMQVMQKAVDHWRRQLMRSLLGTGILVAQIDALALSKIAPPILTLEDHVNRADLIIVGSVKKYVFNGSDVHRPEEYDVDFAEDRVGRRRQALVTVKKVLYSNRSIPSAKQIRVEAPTPQNGGTEWDVVEPMIFVLQQSGTMRIVGEPNTVLYDCLTPPLAANDKRVLAAVKNLQKSKNP